jgi:predicted nucleic acid-binding protein
MENLDALIFIDTNILLDFYRIRNSDVKLSYLDLIDKNHDRIITGSQVEMEYKKNRQVVIKESIGQIKTPNWNTLTPPALLQKSQPVKIIEDSKLEIKKQQSKLRERIVNILSEPGRKDEVYKVLQRLFKNESNWNLNRKNKIRFTVRNLAKKRFILGYPPRKKDDNSIGDAVNWEWIIQCAKESKKDIIIVTRDSDFGINYDNKMFLNDFLNLEFKERISRKRKIVLTDRLGNAFKMISLAVTQEMEDAEDELISDNLKRKRHQEEEVEKIIYEIESQVIKK